jgi:hypothetical protein
MKRKSSSLSPDAFLEAVLDAAGLEDSVLIALETKPKALHKFLEQHPELRQIAITELEEREIDTTEAIFGWLRPNQQAKLETEEDTNWARYKALLEEEPRLEAVESLETAKARTLEMVLKLQAEKRAKLEAKKIVKTREWDWE